MKASRFEIYIIFPFLVAITIIAMPIIWLHNKWHSFWHDKVIEINLKGDKNV